MPVADLRLPVHLQAGGGPSSPDPQVLRAMTTPLIGQFDPDFTSLMDDVMQLAREIFLTANLRCFAVSALASGGLESVLNSLLEEGDHVAIGGSPAFAASVAETARRCDASVVPVESLGPEVRLLVVPFVDPWSGQRLPIADLASLCHSRRVLLVVDATLGLGACELRVDDWGIDVCVAGVDHAIGGPSGMSLVTYVPSAEKLLSGRRVAPRTSYLDLLQLQAYWSPERLNHHTAPTSLVYGMREALRLVQLEGLADRWQRHASTFAALRDGLEALGFRVVGDGPISIVHLPPTADESLAHRQLLEEFSVSVARIAPHTWRVGLLGADARPDAVNHVLSAVEKVLRA